MHKLGLDSLHGYFSRELEPALTINPGDTVAFETLDAGWGAPRADTPFEHPGDFQPRDPGIHFGHALTGPVAIRGARPGMSLELRILEVRTGNWGWSGGVKLPSQIDERLGLGPSSKGPPPVVTVPEDGVATFWQLDGQRGRTRRGWSLELKPFMGIMGMPLDEPGVQSTFPPKVTGGNMDFRELTAGSKLFLPIHVKGGLFSLGDGHAVQGNGEMAGPALACPMEEVRVSFHLHETPLSRPRAWTPYGWYTFGFHADVNEAWFLATEEMLKLMTELHPLGKKEALGLSSLVVDLSLTQVVNGVRGVHACLPHDSLRLE